MRYIKILSLLFLSLGFKNNATAQAQQDRTVLSQFPEWQQARYKAAFEASKLAFLNSEEQNFVLFLNLLRLNPRLFAKTFLQTYKEWNTPNALNYVVMFDRDLALKAEAVATLMPQQGVIKPKENACIYSRCRVTSIETQSCKDLIVSSSAGMQFYENTGLRVLMSMLNRENFEELEILEENPKEWGLHIGSLLAKGKITSGVYTFGEPLKTTQEFEKDLKETQKRADLETYRDFMQIVPQWNAPKYKAANTAVNANYLSLQEKEVYYYLNLARLNPPLFAETFMIKYLKWNDDAPLQKTSYYVRTLYETLKKTTPLPVMVPDQALYETAKCHAVYSGKAGYVGHERKGCTDNYWGECCAYGSSTGLEIVMQLLIDEGVESLGHREACLSQDYSKLGVSIEPHKTYRVNCVMDFK